MPARAVSALRDFLRSESAGGVLLMIAAAAALLTANSPLGAAYFHALHAYLGPLSVEHWINDGLMAVFFLLVGLEIKREVVGGELSTWPRRALPGFAALGGMIAPALIYLLVAREAPDVRAGWAIPAATDIAFALGVLSLLGPRVPGALKIFLAALAIIDDLGAILIIAFFYTDHLTLWALGAAGAVLAGLIGLNRLKVAALWPYLLLGALLWFLFLKSGVHATLAGVLLAMTIPLTSTRGEHSPLHRLEHGLNPWVAYLIVPVFGFANAGVALGGLTASVLTAPATLGAALGLFLGKQAGVMAFSAAAIALGLARRPTGVTWSQLYGVAVLCGVGFTMSLFINNLAFQDALLREETKIGVLAGSVASALLAWLIFALPRRRTGATTDGGSN
ncbi:Na+/H+ antiporter NhaA [Caulobacter flavus]|uniref:Na(+)/H(+) antiporter NhaA n=1 Tax=Caulobacter flavus TaxID=1679497 RepID=A0A2N5CMA1_9CAUL|nr:Na+/H+ antiporter NhaA [Caulobacter flavus]AYV48072.1 Na+/H+ antiporter NhaA [Caulobacter flavus]PLR07004.1 Na+/H+ antiporter NhaA [Caulobacter flavus]